MFITEICFSRKVRCVLISSVEKTARATFSWTTVPYPTVPYEILIHDIPSWSLRKSASNG